MRKRRLPITLTLVLVAALAVAPATTAQDKVTGDFDLDFNECWTGPGDEVPVWIGTVSFDGDVHDMVFFNLGDGRPPNHDLDAPLSPFIEIWAVYDGLDITFDAECALDTYAGDLVMWGHDAGISDFGAKEYAMDGRVAEAFGDYAGLAGESLVMSGTFTLTPEGAPETAPGVIEIG